MLDWQQELQDPKEFMENLKVDLFDEEVFVFTPKGEVKSLAAGATPLDFAYEIHTSSATAASARRSTARSSRSTTS
jgi:GTP pyrophosphokinase